MKIIGINIFAAIFLLAIQSHGQPDKSSIEVLSWNIKMLPRLVRKPSIENQTAYGIGKVIRDEGYDVIVFQEAFSAKSRHIIYEQLKDLYPYTTGPANRKKLSLKTNSGVWVLSRYPIETTRTITYKFRIGVDAFSRKGGLLAELNINGRHIQIIGTHLQSSGSIDVREEQCAELNRGLLIGYGRPDVPQIICGDFNIDQVSDSTAFKFMCKAFGSDDLTSHPAGYSYDPVSNDFILQKNKRPKLIDHILIGKHGDGARIISRKVVPYKFRWSPVHEDLSDHYAVAASVQLIKGQYSKQLEHDTAAVDDKKYGKRITLTAVNRLFVSPDFQLANIEGSYSLLKGIMLGMNIQNSWSFGFSIVGTKDDTRPANLEKFPSYVFDARQLGLVIQYTLLKKQRFNVSFPFIMGTGLARIESKSFSKKTESTLTQRNYQFLQPGLLLAGRISNQFKIKAGVSYNYSFVQPNTSAANVFISSKELSSFIFKVGFDFDLFKWSSHN